MTMVAQVRCRGDRLSRSILRPFPNFDESNFRTLWTSTGRSSGSTDMGRRRARSLTREAPAPTAPAPLVHQYDGDPRAMFQTLKWHVELMNKHGGYLGVIGRRREQSRLFKDLAMGSGTHQMTAEYIEDLCSDLPPVVSSKDEVVLEEPPPSQRDGNASGVAPDGRLSPVSIRIHGRDPPRWICRAWPGFIAGPRPCTSSMWTITPGSPRAHGSDRPLPEGVDDPGARNEPLTAPELDRPPSEGINSPSCWEKGSREGP